MTGSVKKERKKEKEKHKTSRPDPHADFQARTDFQPLGNSIIITIILQMRRLKFSQLWTGPQTSELTAKKLGLIIRDFQSPDS